MKLFLLFFLLIINLNSKNLFEKKFNFKINTKKMLNYFIKHPKVIK